MNIVTAQKKHKERIKDIASVALWESVDASKEEKAFLEPKVHADVDLYIENDNCIFLVAERQEISGFILVKEFWRLTHFFVLPKFQHRGIGLSLLTNAMSLAFQKNGKDYVVVNSSLNAVGFYEKFGFIQDLEREAPSEFVKPMKYVFTTKS